jgi:S1-C subfamily serine protease
MRKRLLARAIVFAVAIMITIPFNRFILPSTAVAQQQQINSNSSSSQSTNSSSPNPLPLKTIFKQVENAVVQVTSKIPTTGVPNPLNPQSPNVTASGSGFVYDKQGHIVTNGHVVGDAKVVVVTFVDGNRYL